MKFNNDNYANTEVELASQLLDKNPQDTLQIERIVYWAAYLGNFELAEKWANSEKTFDTIKEFKNASR